MAYADANLALVASSFKNGFWQYDTTDALNTVLASGYFSSAAGKLRKGDIIVARVATGGTEMVIQLRVASNDGTTVTASGVADSGGLESQVIAQTVTAVLTTDFTMTLPPCTIIRATTMTDVAFTGNTVTQQIGTTVGGAELVAAVSVKALGAVAHTLLLGGVFAGGTLTARLTQTATATAVGTSKLVVEYVPT